MVAQGPTHVSRIYVRGSAADVWKAVTDPHLTRRYFWKADLHCAALEPGSPYFYEQGDQHIVEGHVLEVDPPHRLVLTFTGRWEPAVVGDPPSRITWEITPQPGGVCEVKITNDGFAGVTRTFDRVATSMTFLLSGLKTVVETGSAMVSEP